MRRINFPPDDIKQRRLNEIFNQFSIRFAVLYGSVARGNNNWQSDIDIAVSWPQFLTFSAQEQYKKLGQLNLKSEIAIGQPNVEIRVLEQLNPSIQFRVFRDGFLIFEQQKGIHKLVLESLLLQYYDYAIWEKNYLKQALKS